MTSFYKTVYIHIGVIVITESSTGGGYRGIQSNLNVEKIMV
jgi:hypothetical protein